MFGKKALNIDKFSLSIGHYKVSQATWDDPELLDQDARDLL